MKHIIVLGRNTTVTYLLAVIVVRYLLMWKVYFYAAYLDKTPRCV